jgi:hypothetical protein
MPSPVSFDHQDLNGFLAGILSVYIESKNLGHVVPGPYAMRMAAISRARLPDLIFVQKDRTRLFTRFYLDGPADLVVEVISPESEKRDRKVKFAEYQVAGIREYRKLRLCSPPRGNGRTCEGWRNSLPAIWRSVRMRWESWGLRRRSTLRERHGTLHGKRWSSSSRER